MLNLKSLQKIFLNLYPHLIFFICLCLSLTSAFFSARTIKERQISKLSRATDSIYNSIQTRFDGYQRSLVHVSAYLENSQYVTKREFEEYVETLNLNQNFPEIIAFGYSRKIYTHEIENFEKEQTKSRGENFKVWPKTNEDIHFIIQHLAPINEKNKVAIGYDIYSSLERKSVIDIAIKTGKPSITPQINLVSSGKETSPGFIIFYPVNSHRDITSTKKTLTSSLKGLVYITFRSKDFFSNTFDNFPTLEKDLNVQILNQDKNDSPIEIFRNNSNGSYDEKNSITNKVNLLGNSWVIKTSLRNTNEIIIESLFPITVFLLGLIISVIIFWLLLLTRKYFNAMKISLARFDSIFSNLTDGLVYLTPDGKFQQFNYAALKMYNFTADQISSLKLNDVRHLFELYDLDGNLIPVERRPIQRVLWSGERYTDYELQFERKSLNSSIYVSFNGVPIFNNEGKMILAAIWMKDITYKKKIEADLRKAIDSRDEFIALSSHELKSPLTALKLNSQMTKRKMDNCDLSKEQMSLFLDKTNNQINKLTRLVDDILDVSRIKNNKLHMDIKEVDIVEIVKNQLDILRPQFILNNYPDPILESPESIIGQWDPLRIEQVVTNLLTNSIRYGNSKQVKVEIIDKGQKVIIKVIDTGKGISQDKLNLIFQRYERLTDLYETSGLGLGLYLSQSIIQAHKGKISVESQIDAGSIFTIELPK